MNFSASTSAHDLFAQWLDSPLGQYVMAREQAFFDHAVADRFGYYAVQLELPAYPLLRANRMPTQLSAGGSTACLVRCDAAALPFSTASIDLLLLPHTLDFHPNPREVLREAERVLVPEGRLMLSGFNPWSLWGLARGLQHRQGMPWGGNFLSLPRVRDWLALLGLESEGGDMLCYAPPLRRERWRERFTFLEQAGNRWWPVGGAVYCLESVKRVRGMRLITPAWKPARVAGHSIALGVADKISVEARQSGTEPERD